MALFIGYATVPSTTASWVIAVLWWGFIVAGGLFFLTGLTYLILIVRRRQNPLSQHFIKWQKGSSPKEQKEIIDRQFRQQSTAHKEDSQSLGDGIQPIIIARDKQKATNSQIQDVEMGKHRIRIVELLNIWKEQLSLMIKRTELEDFVANIESDNEFRAILWHCPSVNKKYIELGLARAVCKAKLNPISVVNGEEIKRRASKQEVAEDKRWLNGKMQSVVKAIEDSLKSNEYTGTRCDWCPQDMS